MKSVFVILSLLSFIGAARADFSYKMTQTTGGMMAAMGGGGTAPRVTHYYFKGQKMKFDSGSTAEILDFDARTITTLNNVAQTYSIRPFGGSSAASGDVQANIDVRETGNRKVVNGFNASETLMTMQIESPRGGSMQVEVHIWASTEVPGGNQAREFYRHNEANFPWNSMGGGGNSGMTKAISDVRRKMASMEGMPVEEIIRVTPSGGGAASGMSQMPQMSSAQTAQLAQARAKLQAMVDQGGPAADYARQALTRMPGGSPASSSGASSGALIEITMDSSDFSSAAIPNSEFAISAAYRKSD